MNILREGPQIVGLYKTRPLFFTKEFLNYAEEIWQLDLRKDVLMIEHENGLSIHRFPNNYKIDIISSDLFKCPHKITTDTPVFLQKMLKARSSPIKSVDTIKFDEYNVVNADNLAFVTT